MRKERAAHKRSPVYLLVLLLGILGIFIYLWFGGTRHVGNRLTVALVGDPVTVISYDKSDKSFLMVTLPAKSVIEGVHGYGKYSLTSLWKLGAIERKSGTVLAESVEEMLAMPIPWYIGGPNYSLLPASDPLMLAKSIFSLPRIASFFRGAFVTNMTPKEFLAFATAFSSHKPEVPTIDLTHALVAQPLPDGSSVPVADTNAIDQLVGIDLEDPAIRQEGLSVAVFNTTAVASLGNRISRMLTHAGMLVVSVGNDRPTIGVCLLRGSKKALASQTARFIVDVYGCHTEESVESRADLTLRIGTEYQARFLPFTKK